MNAHPTSRRVETYPDRDPVLLRRNTDSRVAAAALIRPAGARYSSGALRGRGTSRAQTCWLLGRYLLGPGLRHMAAAPPLAKRVGRSRLRGPLRARAGWVGRVAQVDYNGASLSC